MAANTIGFDCKIYYNANTYASPTWTLIANVKDVTLSMEATDIEVANRSASGWSESIQGLKKGAIDFQIDWDTSAAGFTSIRDAFLNGTDLEMAVMDGAIATSGKQGLRATMTVLSFARNEGLEDVVTVDVSVKPTPNANANPAWLTI